MNDSSKQPFVPEKVVQLMVDSIFKKNGIKPEEMKRNISDEQKQMLREMVNDLRKQVDQFNKGNNDITKSSD
ncbi:spore coat protein [Virgibacillus sp. YIM 98842]|jgi:spore coat protein W|uniref:spore coat protein n=1 Tax=Virgibacillus sp. YIM 98842 TaxID=2663533 RepID=UPI0013DBF584|nr:spore coat protein [Virgibacillus sp. YIM 98842]